VAVILYLKLLNLKLMSLQWPMCCNDHNKEMVLIKSWHGYGMLYFMQDKIILKLSNILFTPEKQTKTIRQKQNNVLYFNEIVW